MAEFIQNLDPNNLVVVETIIAFSISPFAVPSYNLPLFLFGAYAQDNSESNKSLRLFTGLLGGSLLLDVIWFTRNEQHWFIRLVSVIVLLLKVPTFIAFGTALQQRGEPFTGLVRGNDLSGPTVWSMPGGFTSLGGGRNGYEPMDGDIESRPRPAPPAAPAAPLAPAPSAPTTVPPTPSGYQAS